MARKMKPKSQGNERQNQGFSQRWLHQIIKNTKKIKAIQVIIGQLCTTQQHFPAGGIFMRIEAACVGKRGGEHPLIY